LELTTVLEILGHFLWKAGATIFVLLLISKVAERSGPFMASIFLTLPMNAGPGYFFIALEVPPEFIAQGALMSFATVAGVLVYTGVYVQATRRCGYWTCVLIASCSWGIAAWLVSLLSASLPNALMSIAAGAVIGVSLRRKLDVFSKPDKQTSGWMLSLIRASTGGLAVASIATTAKFLGPDLTGIAFSFPITFVATSWMLSHLYGLDFSAATIQSAQLTVPTYASFCLVLHLAATPNIGGLSGLQAWGLAIASSLLMGLLMGIFGQRLQKLALAR